MDSRELTGWLVLAQVQHEEREAEEERQRHIRESDDGEVIYHGKPNDDEDIDTDGDE